MWCNPKCDFETLSRCFWLNLRVSESCSVFSWSTVLFRCSQISTTWLACFWLDSTLSCSSASISSLLLLASVARKEFAPSPCWPTLDQQERPVGLLVWLVELYMRMLLSMSERSSPLSLDLSWLESPSGSGVSGFRLRPSPDWGLSESLLTWS